MTSWMTGKTLPLINMCLICDGSSDTCLTDVVQWLMDTNFPETIFRVVPAREVIPARVPLADRLERAYELYKPDLILCHRDAEAAGLDFRRNEVTTASALKPLPVDVVPMVPVRMLESWLLVDESAIRCAANNKNGNIPLDLPNPSRIEKLPDPKARLFDALNTASDLPPQRRRSFNPQHARSRITSFMESFEPLRLQQGFLEFENDFNSAIAKLTAD